jgi:predicted nucleic acid-binding protein
MKPILVLDSTPLGLMFQKPGIKAADDCRRWITAHLARGVRVVIPEIVRYELRRELLRMNHAGAIQALNAFSQAVPNRILAINTASMELAAELWADTRRKGRPTADPHALDIDVLLSAQLLANGFAPTDFVVATSNVSHVSLFVPADLWENI